MDCKNDFSAKWIISIMFSCYRKLESILMLHFIIFLYIFIWYLHTFYLYNAYVIYCQWIFLSFFCLVGWLVCLSVGWLVCQSVIIKGGKLHLHSPIRALVLGGSWSFDPYFSVVVLCHVLVCFIVATRGRVLWPQPPKKSYVFFT